MRPQEPWASARRSRASSRSAADAELVGEDGLGRTRPRGGLSPWTFVLPNAARQRVSASICPRDMHSRLNPGHPPTRHAAIRPLPSRNIAILGVARCLLR
jgi:hypothetical protein